MAEETNVHAKDTLKDHYHTSLYKDCRGFVHSGNAVKLITRLTGVFEDKIGELQVDLDKYRQTLPQNLHNYIKASLDAKYHKGVKRSLMVLQKDCLKHVKRLSSENENFGHDIPKALSREKTTLQEKYVANMDAANKLSELNKLAADNMHKEKMESMKKSVGPAISLKDIGRVEKMVKVWMDEKNVCNSEAAEKAFELFSRRIDTALLRIKHDHESGSNFQKGMIPCAAVNPWSDIRKRCEELLDQAMTLSSTRECDIKLTTPDLLNSVEMTTPPLLTTSLLAKGTPSGLSESSFELCTSKRINDMTLDFYKAKEKEVSEILKNYELISDQLTSASVLARKEIDVPWKQMNEYKKVLREHRLQDLKTYVSSISIWMSSFSEISHSRVLPKIVFQPPDAIEYELCFDGHVTRTTSQLSHGEKKFATEALYVAMARVMLPKPHCMLGYENGSSSRSRGTKRKWQ